MPKSAKIFFFVDYFGYLLVTPVGSPNWSDWKMKTKHKNVKKSNFTLSVQVGIILANYMYRKTRINVSFVICAVKTLWDWKANLFCYQNLNQNEGDIAQESAQSKNCKGMIQTPEQLLFHDFVFFWWENSSAPQYLEEYVCTYSLSL